MEFNQVNKNAGDVVNRRMEEVDGSSCYEKMSPSLVPINRLLKQRDALAHLCGEILSTLDVPGNQQERLSTLHRYVTEWKKKFDQCSGDPNGVTAPTA